MDLQRTSAPPHGAGLPDGAHLQHSDYIDLHVNRPVTTDSSGGQIQKPAPWGQPSPVDRVLWEAGMFVKVDKSTGKLNQPLVKAPVLVNAPQPKGLQNIMRFIVLAAIEQLEKGSVFPR